MFVHQPTKEPDMSAWIVRFVSNEGDIRWTAVEAADAEAARDVALAEDMGEIFKIIDVDG